MNGRRLAARALSLSGCLLLLCSRTAAAAPEIRWLPDHSAVEVHGLSADLLRDTARTPEQWAALLCVQPGGTGDGLPPMLGKWSTAEGTLRFTPRFPLTAGMNYRVTLRPPDGEPVTAVHSVPRPAAKTPTVVTDVFPGGKTVPENLLKFYLHFSAPMSGGGIYRHIHLFNAAGKEVDLPFLELEQELWDREMKRLTLFIDPGRIKREVKPLEDLGPALVAGEKFTLVIDAAWLDAAGQPLGAAVKREFLATPPDRQPPDPAGWRIVQPGAGSREPLRITFSEPMDHALALRLVTVQGKTGAPLSLTAALDGAGTQWTGTPEHPWPAGDYTIRVQPELEDLAGNSVGKPFEVDIAGTEKERPAVKPVEIPFTVR